MLRLANRLRKYLNRKRLTVGEFAEKAGVGKRTVERLLSGDISMTYLNISKVVAGMGFRLELKLLNLLPPKIKQQRGETDDKTGACGEAGQPTD